jgi:hypothetical protein
MYAPRRLVIVFLCSFLGVLVASATASAFCGFFVAGSSQQLSNDASKVALMRKDQRTALTMSNNYKGPPESFAMVVPVPVVLKKEDVKTLPADVFDHIDQLSAPRLVEYWEQDPCAARLRMDEDEKMAKSSAVMMAPAADGPSGSHGVKIEARFAVGEYDILILSAKEASGLETWLKLNHYNIPKGAGTALAPYVKSQMKFFVAKVDIKKVHRDAQGVIVLSPLRVIYDSPDLRLPVRLGLLNANGKQDLLIYVLNPKSRFEAANYLNVFIPTNLEVVDEVRKVFASFYAQLFDETLTHVNNRAVVTEYAWQTDSCDPCPVPPLSQSDLAVLGDDVLSGNQAQAKTPSAGGQPGGYYGDFASWVLTRMHTRYSKDTLTEDIIFREAKPVVGGRANYDTSSMEKAGEVHVDNSNNFQARYIIRHYWQGAVACEKPLFGQWGGPPGGEQSVTAARDLASAPRGKVALPNVVQSALPQLSLPGHAAPARKSR